MPNQKPPVDDTLLDRARSMRHQSAPAEIILWWCLRDRRLAGFKFRRQHPRPPFIADFYCHELHLIIELDGDSHAERREYDRSRTLFLERDGCRVIRFVNTDVFDSLDAVLGEIFRECERLAAHRPHPNPLPEGEGTRQNP